MKKIFLTAIFVLMFACSFASVESAVVKTQNAIEDMSYATGDFVIETAEKTKTTTKKAKDAIVNLANTMGISVAK